MTAMMHCERACGWRGWCVASLAPRAHAAAQQHKTTRPPASPLQPSPPPTCAKASTTKRRIVATSDESFWLLAALSIAFFIMSVMVRMALPKHSVPHEGPSACPRLRRVVPLVVLPGGAKYHCDPIGGGGGGGRHGAHWAEGGGGRQPGVREPRARRTLSLPPARLGGGTPRCPSTQAATRTHLGHRPRDDKGADLVGQHRGPDHRDAHHDPRGGGQAVGLPAAARHRLAAGVCTLCAARASWVHHKLPVQKGREAEGHERDPRHQAGSGEGGGRGCWGGSAASAARALSPCLRVPPLTSPGSAARWWRRGGGSAPGCGR